MLHGIFKRTGQEKITVCLPPLCGQSSKTDETKEKFSSNRILNFMEQISIYHFFFCDFFFQILIRVMELERTLYLMTDGPI